ncbi:MAG: hypothetical protein R6V85_17895 [Polyangia bacterium]
MLLACCWAPSACGPPPYRMELGDSFKQYDESRDYKLITAEGVRVKAREVDNYPKADLEFWTDALAGHLAERGYALDSRECFETDAGLAGCTLDFALPHGAEDWAFSTTLFVVDDEVIVLEAAASYERFTEIEEELDAMVRTFSPE